MVRLLRAQMFVTVRRYEKFQSHNGAIAAKPAQTYANLHKQFQSHNGAIAAPSSSYTLSPTHQFQSHNGAIAAHFLRSHFFGSSSFNPTMVRLLHTNGSGLGMKFVKFQSHNGAIAAAIGGNIRRKL